MPSAHTAVKHELLVRYLDAWTPTALHGHKRVTYVDLSPAAVSAAAAYRVFVEFADLLERHTLTMLLAVPLSFGDGPPGLVMRTFEGSAPPPVFGWFDGLPLPFAVCPLSEVMVVG